MRRSNGLHQAAIPNPTLAPLRALVGRWATTGTHPMLPGTLHGRTSFEWMEGGAFLLMHSEIDEPGVPSGVAVIGSDDDSDELYMLYFDERGVSRKYQMTLRDGTWRFWRDVPGFSQRYTGKFSDDGRTIVSEGELSRDGSSWERDLALTYTRLSER